MAYLKLGFQLMDKTQRARRTNDTPDHVQLSARMFELATEASSPAFKGTAVQRIVGTLHATKHQDSVLPDVQTGLVLY